MSGSARILIVDDDPRLCRTLSRYLTLQGYTARAALNGEEMREKLAADEADLVILDLNLPDEDGFSLARELQANYDLAIVMLTGRTDIIDKIVGLELGADDYVTKPFAERELLARVRSVLRRTSEETKSEETASGSVAHFAGWRLDLDAYELSSPDGNAVALTPHEFQLLVAFVQHGNRVLTREMILELLTGRDWTPEDRSVDVLIGKLRKKLHCSDQGPSLIETVRGVGYKFKPRPSFD